MNRQIHGKERGREREKTKKRCLKKYCSKWGAQCWRVLQFSLFLSHSLALEFIVRADNSCLLSDEGELKNRYSCEREEGGERKPVKLSILDLLPKTACLVREEKDLWERLQQTGDTRRQKDTERQRKDDATFLSPSQARQQVIAPAMSALLLSHRSHGQPSEAVRVHRHR